MLCKNHPEKAMELREDRWVCPLCGYMIDRPQKVLSHEDALKEIKKLTDENIKLRLLLTQHVFDSQELEEALRD